MRLCCPRDQHSKSSGGSSGLCPLNLHWEGSTSEVYLTYYYSIQYNTVTTYLANAALPRIPCHVAQSCASNWLRSSHIHIPRHSVATTSGSRTNYYLMHSIAMFAYHTPPGAMEAMFPDHWKRVDGLRRGGWDVQLRLRAWDRQEETLALSLDLDLEGTW
jgi:hypothetical protein